MARLAALPEQNEGITQEQFADALGMSWSFISQIETNNGKKLRGVSLTTLFKMAEAVAAPGASY